MKKVVSLLLSLIIITSAAAFTASPSYAITGQTSETQSVIYPGITSTHYTLGSGTLYGLQDMTLVEFDPHQEGLSVNVATGYANLNSLSTVSNTVNRWNAAHTDKKAICAINGDWFTVSYDGYSTAMAKKQLYIPLGFNMHGGEIITTQQTAVETSNSGYAPSFGVAADGTPLIGCIDTTTTLRRPYGTTTSIDGINRLPADNAVILYTNKGPASNYCLDDAYEVYISYPNGYTVKHGMKAEGTVEAISAPGEARLAANDHRLILTARGSRISEISDLSVGDRVRIDVSISDRYGKTAKWRTVTDCVGGHHEFCRNGEYFNIGDSTNYPANVIGITGEGKVIFLCNDGRQSGYSVGISINKMATLAQELGIVSGIYMDGGGSTTMVQQDGLGNNVLINRPCNNNHAQRSVGNAVILAYDKVASDDLTFDSTLYGQFVGTPNNIASSIADGMLSLRTTTAFDPFIYLKNINLSADEYKYIAIKAKTTYTSSNRHAIGLYLSAGAITYSTEDCKANVSIKATGNYETCVADLSSLSNWNGDVHLVRIDIFDNTVDIASGQGLDIDGIKFCRTAEEAENAFVTVLPGDVDGNGIVAAKDARLLKQYMVGLVGDDDIVFANADLNGDGDITAKDARALKQLLVG